jgi:hypothetical protein
VPGRLWKGTDGIESGADAGFRSRSGVGWSEVEEKEWRSGREKRKRRKTPRCRNVSFGTSLPPI